MAKFFIEIGSCDFRTLAPLGNQGWQGILIEPVAELLDNIPRVEGLIYENCAITDYKGTTEITYYDPKVSEGDGWANNEEERWIRGVGNINQDMNHFHSNPQWKQYEKTSTVDCCTLDDILDKHNVKQIDLLKIDTEGHEWTILNNYSWKIKPSIINLEVLHEGVLLGKEGIMAKFLQDKGYYILDERHANSGDNLTAIL